MYCNSFSRKMVLPLILLLLPGLALSASELYEKQESWPDTMVHARAAWRNREDSGVSELLTLGTWYKTRAYGDVDFDDMLLPEKAEHLNQRDEDGGRVWHRDKALEDDTINLLSCGDRSAIYVARTLRVREPMLLNIGLGSDDGLQVLLNGALIHSNNTARTTSANADLLTLPLLEENNLLILKIYNLSGRCGIYFHL